MSSDAAGPRSYRSPVRAAQARETRRTIVAAAAELFVRDGYAATTIDAIAVAAGVSRRTVFNAVGGKAVLLRLAHDWSLVGDDEPVPMADRPAVRQILACTDPAEAIRLWVAMIVEVGERAMPVLQAVMAAADGEPDAADLMATAQSQRHAGALAFAEHLAALGGLHPDLSPAEAADLFWAQSDPTVRRLLTVDRAWPVQRYTDWLVRTLSAAVLPERAATRRSPRGRLSEPSTPTSASG